MCCLPNLLPCPQVHSLRATLFLVGLGLWLEAVPRIPDCKTNLDMKSKAKCFKHVSCTSFSISVFNDSSYIGTAAVASSNSCRRSSAACFSASSSAFSWCLGISDFSACRLRKEMDMIWYEMRWDEMTGIWSRPAVGNPPNGIPPQSSLPPPASTYLRLPTCIHPLASTIPTYIYIHIHIPTYILKTYLNNKNKKTPPTHKARWKLSFQSKFLWK